MAQAAALLDARRQDPEAWRSYCWPGMSRICADCGRSCPRSIWRSSLRPAARVDVRRRACCAAVDRARRRLEALLGVGSLPPIAVAELDALIGEEERVLAPRGGLSCRLQRATTARGAVAAAARGVPRGRRAGARSALAAAGAGGGDAATAGWRMSRWSASWCGTSTRRSSRRTARWSSTRRRGALVSGAAGARRAAGGDGVPGHGGAAVRRRWRRWSSRSTACCTRAGSATGTRSTRVRRRIVDADNAYSEQLASAHGPLSYRGRGEPRSWRASSTPTCRATSGRRC